MLMSSIQTDANILTMEAVPFTSVAATMVEEEDEEEKKCADTIKDVGSCFVDLPSVQAVPVSSIKQSLEGASADAPLTDPLPALPRTTTTESLVSNFADACRICHCEADGTSAPLISPCSCSGTLKYVHQACLQQWIKSANTKSCELCKLDFQMTTSVKPFRKWQKLDMTKIERRKVICSVTFHIIAITCVVWSLYVLIDRTTEEISQKKLEWPFWTKLVVVAIGFTGGLVFMYVQCKMYFQLCRRWRAYNRVIYVQDCPMTARNAVIARKCAMATGAMMTLSPQGPVIKPSGAIGVCEFESL